MNSGGPLFVVNADGSGLHRVSGPKLEKYESDLDPVWSPNGQQLVFDGRGDGWTAIFVVHVDGSGERKLAGGPSSRGDPGVFGGNAWSPDGRKIAFTDRHGVAVISPDGSGRRRLTRRASVLWSGASWSPDGRELAFAGSEAIWVVRANGTGLRRLVSATAAGLDVGSTGGLGLPVWSPDGRTLAFDTRKRLVYVINRDGSGLRSVGSRAKLFWWSQGLSEVEWSPDGRELVFTSYPDSDDNGDIDVVNADGSGERWLTRSKLDECCAVWSPVG
jgi:Tol biopolymer transport system component